MAGLVASTSALPLSLGEAEAVSELGQPFHAQVPFQLAAGEDVVASCIRAHAARPESMSEIPTLSQITPSIEVNGNRGYIHLQSAESTAEPILLLTVIVQCGSLSRLRREYTLLQELPDPSAPAKPTTPPPVEITPRFPAPARLPEPVLPAVTPAAASAPAAAAQAPATKPAARPPAAPARQPAANATPPAPVPALRSADTIASSKAARSRPANPNSKGSRDVLRLDAGDDMDIQPRRAGPGLKLAYELAEREGATEPERERLRREFAERLRDDNIYTRVLALGDEIAGLKLQITQMQEKDRQEAEARQKTVAAEADKRSSLLIYGGLGLIAVVAGAWLWIRRPRRERFDLPDMDMPGMPARSAPFASTSAPLASIVVPAEAAPPPATPPSVRHDPPPAPPAIAAIVMADTGSVASLTPPSVSNTIEYQPAERTVVLSAPVLQTAAASAAPLSRSDEHLRIEAALHAHQARKAAEAAGHAVSEGIAAEKRTGPAIPDGLNAAIDFKLDTHEAKPEREINPDTADFDLPSFRGEGNTIDFDISTDKPETATKFDLVLDTAPAEQLDFKLDAESPAQDLGFSLDLPMNAPEPAGHGALTDEANEADEDWILVPSPPAAKHAPGAPPAAGPALPRTKGVDAQVDAQAAVQRALRYRHDYIVERFPEVAAGGIALDKPSTVIDGARTIYQEDMDVSRAIALLQVAWAMHPHDSLWLALLEIYWLEGMQTEFCDLAQQFAETFTNQHKQWPMIAKLGRGMDEDNPIFKADGLPEVTEAAPNWMNTQLDMMAHVLARELRGQIILEEPGDAKSGGKT